nr:MAG TPA: hypothetical protein [Caudoviricetes sp.]
MIGEYGDLSSAARYACIITQINSNRNKFS